MGRTLDLGKICITLADGAWDSKKPYEALTLIYHGGDGYISRHDNIGVEPGTDDTTWYLIVRHGQIPEIRFDQEGNMYADDVLVTTVFRDVVQHAIEAMRNDEEYARAEASRREAETARRTAEDERILAERQRNTAETNRSLAEETRVRSENSRVEAETARAAAEVERNARFNEAIREAVQGVYKGDTGPQGPQGKSAYQVAVDGGYEGTESEWLASQVGPQGKSAYQVAVDAGFEGTISEWLLSLKGAQGIPGPAGVSSVVVTSDALSSDNPTCEASVENGVLNLAFSGLKGRPGVGFESVSSQQDGTLVITLTDGSTVTIDLNHNHPQYLKYVMLNSESEMPANPDSTTLYMWPETT